MMLGERYCGPKGAVLAERSSGLCAERRWSYGKEAHSRVASAVCQSYDQVLPLAVGEWEEWRFAATGDVLKLRLTYAVVKLRRRAAVAYGAPARSESNHLKPRGDAFLCAGKGPYVLRTDIAPRRAVFGTAGRQAATEASPSAATRPL